MGSSPDPHTDWLNPQDGHGLGRTWGPCDRQDVIAAWGPHFDLSCPCLMLQPMCHCLWGLKRGRSMASVQLGLCSSRTPLPRAAPDTDVTKGSSGNTETPDETVMTPSPLISTYALPHGAQLCDMLGDWGGAGRFLFRFTRPQPPSTASLILPGPFQQLTLPLFPPG